jgi:hypothetical protein
MEEGRKHAINSLRTGKIQNMNKNKRERSRLGEVGVVDTHLANTVS